MRGPKGPACLISIFVIKSSDCEAKPHSPAVPSGRVRRGFHGYHSEEENIQIKAESKVRPGSASLGLACGAQGSRAEARAASSKGQQLHRAGKGKAGSGETAGGPEGGMCPPSPLPPFCPDQLATRPLPPQEGRGAVPWARCLTRLRPPFPVCKQSEDGRSPCSQLEVEMQGGHPQTVLGPSRGSQPSMDVGCRLIATVTVVPNPARGLSKRKLPVRMFSDITWTWTSTECLEV